MSDCCMVLGWGRNTNGPIASPTPKWAHASAVFSLLYYSTRFTSVGFTWVGDGDSLAADSPPQSPKRTSAFIAPGSARLFRSYHKSSSFVFFFRLDASIRRSVAVSSIRFSKINENEISFFSFLWEWKDDRTSNGSRWFKKSKILNPFPRKKRKKKEGRFVE